MSLWDDQHADESFRVSLKRKSCRLTIRNLIIPHLFLFVNRHIKPDAKLSKKLFEKELQFRADLFRFPAFRFGHLNFPFFGFQLFNLAFRADALEYNIVVFHTVPRHLRDLIVQILEIIQIVHVHEPVALHALHMIMLGQHMVIPVCGTGNGNAVQQSAVHQ